MHVFTLPAKTILTLRNRTPSLETRERMQTGIFRALAFSLLLASVVPAVDALLDPEPYATYQNAVEKYLFEESHFQAPRPHGRAGVLISALFKLMACGFVLVLMWKRAPRGPVRAMILFIGFLSMWADPPLSGFLQRHSSLGTESGLWAIEFVEVFAIAALLRFAALFPRQLTSTELLPRLAGAHPGMLRRTWRNVNTLARRVHVTRFFRVSGPDAAVLFLASVAAVMRVSEWSWMLNRYVVSGAAIAFVIIRVATNVRVATQTSASGLVAALFQIGPVLVTIAAIGLFIQPHHGWVDNAARLALFAFLIRGGTATLSRLPSAIGWFNAAIVLTLATFMFLAALADWGSIRNYLLAAAAFLIVVIRSVATAVRLWIRSEEGAYFSQSWAGPLLVILYVLAVITRPTRAVALGILVLTIACLPWMLRRTPRSYLLVSDLQLALTRPFPVWSTALVAYSIGVAAIVSLKPIVKASVVSGALIGPMEGVKAVAGVIAALVVAATCVGMLLSAVKFLRIGYEVGDASARKRMLWIVEGVAVVAGIQVVAPAAEFVLSGMVPLEVIAFGKRLANSAILPVVLLSLGVAVFYHGALDPRLAIRRTILNGATFLLLAALFGGVENLAEPKMSPTREMWNWPPWVVTMIVGGITALAFIPIRHLCDVLARRYFPIAFRDAVEAESTRRAATVVTIDLVGYSARTLDDERGASATVALLRQVVKKVASATSGRVIEWSRDFALLEFPDVARAVTASRRMFERLDGATDSRALPHARLRASVHVGDVWFAADGGVTGRAVIVANRLRELAAEGEILLSQTAMAGLPHGMRRAVEDLGPTPLRDVPEPQQCFRLRVR